MEDLQTRVEELEKKMEAMVKEVQKIKRVSKKQERENNQDKPKRASAFNKPVPVTKELCKFLAVAEGSLVARSEVTNKVAQYVKQNNLQEEANKRNIICDENLSSLLGVKDLTWFQLQKYLAPHYIKEDKKAAAPKTPVTNGEAPPPPEEAPKTVVKKVVTKKTVKKAT